jgi:oligopeptide/dipeptide ABC transporter ATP-binding protein
VSQTEGHNSTFLLKVDGLKKHFLIRRGLLGRLTTCVYAVDGINFAIRPGETLGLVGESGCGKSTVGRCLIRIYNPTEGRIEFLGEDITNFRTRDLVRLRKQIQMIFQDPYSSLNPRMRVRDIIGESLHVHKLVPKDEWLDRVVELLRAVGLKADHMARYPHEFSGGQRQRIGIARALAMNPKLIVADEPVSALDVSVQAQVINLVESLKSKFNLSYLVIAHDLSVVEHVSDRLAVMYLGKIVEAASDRDIYLNPMHPYTEALLAAVPLAAAGGRDRRLKRKPLTGDVPSPIDPPTGCHFHTRCPKVMNICKREEPTSIEVRNRHFVSCFLHA